MNTIARIFGTRKAALAAPEEFIMFTNEKGDERVRMVLDESTDALGARWNAQMIYGAANVPKTMGMTPLVEVKDKDGNWKPVVGTDKAQFSTETQMAALSSWRETGIIGPQPVTAGAPGEIGGGTGAVVGETGTTAPLSFAGISPMPASAYSGKDSMIEAPVIESVMTASATGVVGSGGSANATATVPIDKLANKKTNAPAARVIDTTPVRPISFTTPRMLPSIKAGGSGQFAMDDAIRQLLY